MVSDKENVAKRRMHSMPELPVERQRSVQIYKYAASQDGSATLTHEGERQGGAVRGHLVLSSTKFDAVTLQDIQRELETLTSTKLERRSTSMGYMFLEPI
jgi:hypothetical protein